MWIEATLGALPAGDKTLVHSRSAVTEPAGDADPPVIRESAVSSPCAGPACVAMPIGLHVNGCSNDASRRVVQQAERVSTRLALALGHAVDVPPTVDRPDARVRRAASRSSTWYQGQPAAPKLVRIPYRIDAGSAPPRGGAAAMRSAR